MAPDPGAVARQRAAAQSQVRACVRCGLCAPACPTQVVTGDERDSPRGRIKLMDAMVTTGRVEPDAVPYVDRCLSCLACKSACPSGVDYRRLSDEARQVIERSGVRPPGERMRRAAILALLSRPGLARIATAFAPLGRALMPVLPAVLRDALAALPAARAPAGPFARPRVWPAQGTRTARIGLVPGCIQQVLGPEVNAAAIRLLTRHGVEVMTLGRAGCCGGLAAHLGQTDTARAAARRLLGAAGTALETGAVDSIVTTASGCAPTMKDYAHLFDGVEGAKFRAARVAEAARDVLEVIDGLAIAACPPRPVTVAWHAPCSLTHGQGLGGIGERVLRRAGFTVVTPADPACCGSAGAYSLLQPVMAAELGARKAVALAALGDTVIATSNLGCAVQIGRVAGRPVAHVVELLDWATGGPEPAALRPA